MVYLFIIPFVKLDRDALMEFLGFYLHWVYAASNSYEHIVADRKDDISPPTPYTYIEIKQNIYNIIGYCLMSK